MVIILCFTVLDATGKPPIGLFQGNLNWIGQYDQCYRIQADRSNISTQETIEKNVFQGSYCDIQMDVKKALPFIDIPAAVCNDQDQDKIYYQ